VGERVLVTDRQVRGWVVRYNGGGAEALADRPGRGRHGPLTGADEERLKARLRAGPTAADGGACALRGADAQRILAAEFGVARSLSAVYDLLHRLGFEPLRPRPRHPRADPGAQDQFKKRSRARSRR
jgi:transposase